MTLTMVDMFCSIRPMPILSVMRVYRDFENDSDFRLKAALWHASIQALVPLTCRACLLIICKVFLQADSYSAVAICHLTYHITTSVGRQ